MCPNGAVLLKCDNDDRPFLKGGVVDPKMYLNGEILQRAKQPRLALIGVMEADGDELKMPRAVARCAFLGRQFGSTREDGA